MNKQEVTRFCLAEVKKKQFSSAIHLGTVGKSLLLPKGNLLFLVDQQICCQED